MRQKTSLMNTFVALRILRQRAFGKIEKHCKKKKKRSNEI